MSPGPEPFIPPQATDWSALKDAVKRFEQAWRAGLQPVIDNYLPAAGELRSRALIELVHIDLELQLKAGKTARVEQYLARYPELQADFDIVHELIAAEQDYRQRTEPDLALEEYVQRFPHFRSDLLNLATKSTVAGIDTRQAAGDRQAETPPAVEGYEVIEPLGRGGMGIVFKARQHSLNRLVALKFLPEVYARDPAWLARFRLEARTASALNHPHICTIYDTGESDGRPYLSMELVEGKTLEALLGKRPPIEELIRLIAQAARALAAAHVAGVVHRDIKPANLMVRDDGILKVLDFGLAHRLPSSELQASLSSGLNTDPGVRVGTLLYMSPEQARAEPVDAATDIFSLGLVLYELATGRHPFRAVSEVAVLLAVVGQTPAPPTRLNPEVPAPLEALILQMLSKDHRLRPTAVDVETALIRMISKPVGATNRPQFVPTNRPTVGRKQELNDMQAGFEQASAGHGLVLCVTGEPGLGKTTFVEQFIDHLAANGQSWNLARGRCSERLAGAEAYLPILEALDSLIRLDDCANLANMLKVLAPSWYVQLSPLTASDPALAPVLAEAKDASQERRKRELAIFLHELTRQRPLIVFLDDLHWADPSSVDLLAYLGTRCSDWRILLLVTYRPSELRRSQHPFGRVQLDLQTRGVCREISLPFLTFSDLAGYLDLALPGHQLPREFAGILHARTEGNPLFVVDLVRYLRDRHVIAQENGCWTLTQPLANVERELPESIRSMIQRKTDQLEEADRRLLMAASVQGTEFDSALVAEMLQQEAAEVEERLEVLERIHVLVRLVKEQTFPDGTLTLRYSFVHVLYQNAFYATLQPSRKAAWSATAALALLTHYGNKSGILATELALLFEAARNPAQATEYFLQAARNEARVFAHQETVALARRGLILLEKLTEAPSRDQRELDILLVLGVALVATKGFASPDVERCYERARTLCQRAANNASLFPVLYGLWNVYLLRCELARCKELATQMFALAQGQSDPILLLQAHNVLQQPLLHLGEFTSARLHQEQCLALYNSDKHHALTSVYGEDPGVGCQLYLAVTLWCLGYPDQALRSAQSARRLAESLSNPFDVARALYFGAFVHLCRREFKPTQLVATELMTLALEQEFSLLQQGALILQGWSLAEQSQTSEGLDEMQRGLAGWQATGAISHRPYQLVIFARALASVGRRQEGLAALEESLALTETTGERFLEAELQRVRGEVLLTGMESDSSAWSAAEACFHQALDVARRQSARSLELRAVVSLARLYQASSRQSEARQLLAACFNWFSEGFESPDLLEAMALLKQLT